MTLHSTPANGGEMECETMVSHSISPPFSNAQPIREVVAIARRKTLNFR